ncbi:hypothetical protein [Colwellia maritima]|uniref:hypothetical protein n=1 Tax=Colwellia maritima TaxID=2912588 RepID=UPI003B845D50
MVNNDNIAEIRVIKIGRSIGQNWLVLSGLVANEKVITTGLQKIAPGAPVTPVHASLEVK